MPAVIVPRVAGPAAAATLVVGTLAVAATLAVGTGSNRPARHADHVGGGGTDWGVEDCARAADIGVTGAVGVPPDGAFASAGDLPPPVADRPPQPPWLWDNPRYAWSGWPPQAAAAGKAPPQSVVKSPGWPLTAAVAAPTPAAADPLRRGYGTTIP